MNPVSRYVQRRVRTCSARDGGVASSRGENAIEFEPDPLRIRDERYGFYPDATCPFGRLQPHLAVGPAIMFASQDPAFTSGTNTTSRFIDGATPLGAVAVISPPNHRSFSSSSDATICLEAEAGLRWMALKNVSLDVSFKYRYAQPTFSGTYTRLISAFSTGLLARATDSYTFSPTFHLFSFQVGAAYHF